MTGSPGGQRLADAYAYCDTTLRDLDRDRWLACLFAPGDKRACLHALYAFSIEIARVREIVSEPQMGEIRLQWWRDVISGEARGDVAGHPVALALLDIIRQFRLPGAALTALIDARAFDLYNDPMPSLSDLEGYCGETSSALMRLASLILADGVEPGGADAVGHAGVAFGMTGLLRAIPWHAARGQVFIPADLLKKHGAASVDIPLRRMNPQLETTLAEMRSIIRRHRASALAAAPMLAPAARPVLVPLGICEAYLRRMEKSSFDPFRDPSDLPQWRRQWELWRFSRRL